MNADLDPDRRRFLEGIALATSIAAVGLPAAAQSRDPAATPPPPLRDVAGKVAFITGASSGIGLGMARAFSAAGMKVVIGYIRDDQLAPALAQFPNRNAGLHAIKVDVTDRDAMTAAAAETEKVFGKVHLLANNAGVGVAANIGSGSYKDWDFTLGVNLTGVFNGIQSFLPRIRAHGEGGHILSTSSMSGLLPILNGGAGIYTATKFAVVGMMECLRCELEATGANIGVSVFCPGLVNTSIYEVDRNRPGAVASGSKAEQEAAAAREQRMKTSVMPAGMDPLEAGERVLRGVRANDLYILTHAEFAPGTKERHDTIMASFPRGETAPAARLAMEANTLRNPLYLRELERLSRRAL